MNEDKTFPIGCLQFEYSTQGLVSTKELNKQLETQYLYKIEIKKGNMKFKAPCRNVSLKILSNINYIETSKTHEASSAV